MPSGRVTGRALLGLLLLLPALPAQAAGFHFFKVEAIAGASDDGAAGGLPLAGAGFSAFSDALHAWVTFGDPAADGRVVREGWLESRAYGPVIGVVPPAFQEIVEPYPVRWIVPWTSVRIGGDARSRRSFEVDAAQHFVLDVPGFWNVDSRRVYAGPSLGLGLNGTWWRDWKDAPDTPAMTGKVTAEAGLVAGATVRDTWYAQVAAVGHFDLFGAHQQNLRLLAVTGLFLDRLGVPFGVEVRGQLDQGDDNVHAAPDRTWVVHAALFWKLTPPFETRIEERVERRVDQQSQQAAANQ